MRIDSSGNSFRQVLYRQLRSFEQDRRGAVAYLTALFLVAMVGLTGLAVDYGSAVVQKGKLDAAAQAAVTSGANAARNLLQLNLTQNSQFDSEALAEGERVANEAFDGQLGPATQVNISTKYVTFARVGNTISAQFDYQGEAQTVFSKALGLNDITVKGSASIIIGLVENPPSSKLLEEVWGVPNAPVTTRVITDPTYRDWRLQDGQPKLGPTNDSRVGTFALQIGDGANSSIAKKVYMPAGFYELRYWYKSSVVYPDYQPAHICNALYDNQSTWAMADKYREYTSSVIVPNSPQSARISVYLHPVKEDPRLAVAPPRSTEFTNRLDTCIYAGRWIERAIKLEITNSGYFWLGFVADALPNSNKRGGWISNIKICIASCADTFANNFPYRTGDILMEDNFDSPVVARNTLMNLTRPVFTPQALYETLPSTAWSASDPQSLFLSREVVSPAQGQHVLGIKSQWMTRRILLPPGRYAIRMYVIGDGRSFGCPKLGTEREGGGISLCGSDPTPATWGAYNYCITTLSTHFMRVGIEFFMPRTGVGQIRADLFQFVAGYPGGQFQLRPSPPFCNSLITVGMSGMGEQWGNLVRRLDRVNVTPTIWQ